MIIKNLTHLTPKMTTVDCIDQDADLYKVGCSIDFGNSVAKVRIGIGNAVKTVPLDTSATYWNRECLKKHLNHRW